MGGVVLVLGLVSDWLKEQGISDALLALGIGVVLGPYVAKVFPPPGAG
jgi:NhaP-type Na+/H+ or K+/H+ antiporter